ncbi:MAG: hypothetical protein ABFD50_09155 [Smithella sp.]|jgi:hypothetical protein
MYDISRFDSNTLSEKGIEVEVPDPVDGTSTGVFFTLLGADSKVYEKAIEEVEKRNKAHGKTGISYEDTCEILSRATLGWKGLGKDGKELPFSQDAAKREYMDKKYLANFVSGIITNRRNYFQKP